MAKRMGSGLRGQVLLAIILGVVMIFFCTVALAETSGTCGENLTWVLDDDGELTISGTGKMEEYVWLAGPWGTEVKTAVIEDGVTNISSFAFYKCSNLTSITLPDSLTSIGERALYKCNSLMSIIIPDGVTSIGEAAFYNGTGLTTITLSDGLTNIGREAFSHCSSVTRITIPESLVSISDWAFSSCSSLTSITIPDSVTSIGDGAFSSCSSLTSIMIPDHVTSIGANAFNKCNAIKYTYKDTDSAIALSKAGYSFREPGKKFDLMYTFDNETVSGLEICNVDKDIVSINIPEDVTNIDNSAFFGCSSLISITLPEGVTSMGNEAFYKCSSLMSITLPDGLTNIGESVFRNCSSLTSITLPEGLTSIGESAFRECSSLTSITLPESLISIGKSAFHRCRSLTSITIPESVKSIGDSVFYLCSGLTSITLPEGLMNIGESAFSYCNSLTSITLPESLTSIGISAFSNCNRLTNITIPEGVTSIGDSAFNSCSSLTSITIPEGVTSIGDSAFNSCSSLMNITLPESLTSIGADAFSYCRNLKSITIPANVQNVGNGAFASISGLTKASVLGMDTQMGSDMFEKLDVQIYCYRGSEAESWAEVQGYPVTHIEDMSLETEYTIELPSDFRLACGNSCDLQAKIFPEGDSTQIQWSVSDSAVLSVNQGVVTALNPGTCTVTAELGSNSNSVTITTYRTVDDYTVPEELWGIINQEITLPILSWEPQDAILSDIDWMWYYQNGYSIGTKVTRSSPIVLQGVGISRRGTIHTCILHVCYPVTAIAFDAEEHAVEVGQDLQLTANVTMRDQHCVNHLVTFTSSDESIATVNAETGLVHSVATGDVTITATSESEKTASSLIHVVDACEEHIPVVDAAVPATCTETGLTEGSHCARCEQILVPQEIVEPLGHTWGEPEYTWAEDHYSLTAIRTCIHNAEHTETETAGATRRTEQAATCEETGFSTYTSQRFLNPAFTRQTITVEDLAPKGHRWSRIAYTWSEDYSTVTGARVCSRDESHTQGETVSATAERTKEPTCTEPGETTYTGVAFENPDFQAQVLVLANIEALGHDWGEITYTWAEDNQSVTAERICQRDGAHIETETAAVQSEITLPATCLTEGETTYTSEAFSNEAFEVQTKTMTDLSALGHLWSEPEYSWGENHETLTAVRICGHDAEHIETETVEVTAEVTLEPTCEEMGQTTYTSAAFENEAFAPQNITETDIAALGHTIITDEAVSASCVATGLTEGSHCEVCGKILIAQETIGMLPHQYVVDEAVPATCEHTGLSSGIHCASCHTVFLAQMETPMTDHAWGEPVYEWAEDYSTVTATRYCRHNESHMETETVAASGEITKAATCSEMGETTYTSEAFENAAFEAQSTVLANVEKIEHTPVTDEAVEPTCVAIGLTEGSHCEVCGEILVRQEPIGKLEHQYVVDEAVPATCEHTGLSSGIHCASCQTVFLAQTETPAIGHEWDEPAYTWTEDNGMVTASRVCLHDNSHSETETVAATAEVTKESTCSEMGETTYTSEIFENEAFAVQTKIVTDVEKTAHTPVIDEAVEPTQDSTGLTEGSHCAICGEILVAQEVIPALGDDQGTCGDNLTWRLNDEGLLTISGTGDMTDFSFQLITNYSYVIDSPWYEVRESIRTVVLENGVTSVGRNAFLNCSNLESVILPDSLAKIGPAAFCSCSSLSDIVIPKGITCLDDDLFYGCTNLARIEIPENVTRIGFCTFGECESLRSITIPNNVTIIDTAAFDACINLTNVILPDGINMISNGAFQRCRSLTSIVIPDGVLSISDNAFNNCESLSSITIPESVTAIGSNAFVVCSNLSSVYYSGTEEQWNEIEIGEGNELLNGAEIHYSDVEFRNILNLPATLTTIESEAFANLTNVDAIRIPESVVEIANDAFAGSDITIITPAGSYAEDWANNPEHEYPCITE